ncbi:lipoyl(octanoyl) transferase [Candidatus Nanopelagicus hibericus]|uniref:Octanoyltransferase n=1 Tax=Candidatus Nanopelagicus hibericus TaxID=1884915 RepID=A0A249K8W8_9ACTN|nr:lipoyl(octanoyl) transferase LipB [Candidatus Nanopelagicus hibericus]ASY13224.1 lipoyl(octanoyl) transferase [Candidatus Nanopelagicus hibericus]
MSSTILMQKLLKVEVLGEVEYLSAWQMQKQIAEDVISGKLENTLLLLQHPSVYTAGRRTELSDRPLDNTPVIDVDRGGKITWHGIGQIVGYPIVKLKNPTDVVGFVRELENALIQVCAEFGVLAQRYCERSGVWVRDEAGDRKIAAIGLRVAKGVTMHGFALNVNPDLSAYSKIIPCGIPDAKVTSLAAELSEQITTNQVMPVLQKYICPALESLAQ